VLFQKFPVFNSLHGFQVNFRGIEQRFLFNLGAWWQLSEAVSVHEQPESGESWAIRL
jgi:hypothetical protein